MSIPSRPRVLLDEAESCVVAGVELRHKTCTNYAYAMHVERSSIGRHRPSGCGFRRLTGDTSGGTTIQQNERIAREEYGIVSEVRVGPSVASPTYAASRLRQGRSIVLQGNAGVLVGTPFRTTKGPVNHAVLLNEGRGWHTNAAGLVVPTEGLVYDPEANGDLVAWGRKASGPDWWPWALILRFAAALRPWGDTDPRTLGPGKWYCAIGPDTEPHVHLRFAGSVRTTPFPDAMTARSPIAGRRVNVRSGPSTKYPIVATLASGAGFSAYQRNDAGQALTSGGTTSRTWYGDHNGTRWVHSSGVRT